MSGKLRIDIAESTDELCSLLRSTSNLNVKEKLQALFWLKSGQASQATQVADLLGHTRVTISRWLRDYRQGGLSALTEPKPRSGRPPAISGDALAQLQRELQDERGFSSYVEVQTWLEAVWGLKLPYSTVHDTVRYRLGAKLKASRPVDVKPDPNAAEELKKTPRAHRPRVVEDAG